MRKSLWSYRNFIAGSIKREFQSKCSKSIFGTIWMFVNPLYMCVIYTAIFSSIMDIKDDQYAYTIYVGAGVLTWNFFTDILTRSQNSYIYYSDLIKKQNFPHLCLPLIILSVSGIDFIVSFAIFTTYTIIIGKFPGWPYISFLPILLLQSFFAIGLGNALGVLNVFFRDIGKIMVMLLQIWFWMTPIIYFIEKAPPQMQYLLSFNPLTAMMNAYQAILVKQQWPEWNTLIFPLTFALSICVLFLLFHRKHIAEILDDL